MSVSPTRIVEINTKPLPGLCRNEYRINIFDLALSLKPFSYQVKKFRIGDTANLSRFITDETDKNPI